MRPSRLFFFLLASFSVLGGCQKGRSLAPLEVVRWSGSGGTPVSLDVPLRVEFDQRLAQQPRLLSVSVMDSKGNARSGWTLETTGRFLEIHPRLPRLKSLADGTFPAGERLTLRLRGLPHLAAIQSETGATLAQDTILELTTSMVKDPAALAGVPGGEAFLRLRVQSGGLRPQIPVRRDGTIQLPTQQPVDPRTLVHPAMLERPGAEPLEVELKLLENSFDGAVLGLEVGPQTDWTVLHLPAQLEGLGGLPLLEADRLVRLVPMGR